MPEAGYAWSVRFLETARRQFLDLPPPRIRIRIGKKIRFLKETPFPPGAKKLKHPEEIYRLRVGDYRVLYRVAHANRLIEIFRVRHRRDAYRGL